MRVNLEKSFEAQTDFKKGRSTQVQTFTLKRIIEKPKIERKTVAFALHCLYENV